jgi:hypothetical protein
MKLLTKASDFFGFLVNNSRTQDSPSDSSFFLPLSKHALHNPARVIRLDVVSNTNAPTDKGC